MARIMDFVMSTKSKKKKTEASVPQGFTFRGQEFTSAYTVLFRMAGLLDLTEEEIAYAQELADICPADEGGLLDAILENHVEVPEEETK